MSDQRSQGYDVIKCDAVSSSQFDVMTKIHMNNIQSEFFDSVRLNVKHT